MNKEIITFDDIETKKQKFYRYKSPSFLEDVNINNLLVSGKIYSSEINNKYLIGYLYNDYKNDWYVKDGKTKWIYFLIDDDSLLKKDHPILIVKLYTIKTF